MNITVRDSFLARREAAFRTRTSLSLSLVIPLLVTGAFLWRSFLFTTGTTFLGATIMAVLLGIAVHAVLRRTLLTWSSRQLHTLARCWWTYTGLVVAAFLVQAGHDLLSAGHADDVMRAAVAVRVPFQEIAPAILVGPLAYAFVRDAYDLSGPTHKAAVRRGFVAIVVALAVPVVLFLVGAWYGSLDHGLHLFTFERFKAAIIALGIAVVAAGVLAWVALMADLQRARRHEERLVRGGIA